MEGGVHEEARRSDHRLFEIEYRVETHPVPDIREVVRAVQGNDLTVWKVKKK